MATCERHTTVEVRDDGIGCYMCRLEQEISRFMPRQPNYRYFEVDGWMFCWTTERLGDGKFAAFIYKPVGKGSQSGKAQRWEMVKEIHFAKRSTAKARALKWYESRKRAAARV